MIKVMDTGYTVYEVEQIVKDNNGCQLWYSKFSCSQDEIKANIKPVKCFIQIINNTIFTNNLDVNELLMHTNYNRFFDTELEARMYYNNLIYNSIIYFGNYNLYLSKEQQMSAFELFNSQFIDTNYFIEKLTRGD